MRDELNERFTFCLSFATKMAVFLPFPLGALDIFVIISNNPTLTLPLYVPILLLSNKTGRLYSNWGGDCLIPIFPHTFSLLYPLPPLLNVTDCSCYPNQPPPPPMCPSALVFPILFPVWAREKMTAWRNPLVPSYFLSRTREALSILYSFYNFFLFLLVFCEAGEGGGEGKICSRQVINSGESGA